MCELVLGACFAVENRILKTSFSEKAEKLDRKVSLSLGNYSRLLYVTCGHFFP